MLGSGEATKKLGPENMGSMRRAARFGTIAVVVSSSLWLVQLSAAALACAGRGFILCASQRPAEDAPGLVPLRRLKEEEEDDDVRLLPEIFLFASQRSPQEEEARPGLELLELHDEAGLLGISSFLCASHLSTESARPGLVLGLEAKDAGRMMRHGRVGGVGRRPGRSDAAALAIARSTDAIGGDRSPYVGPRNTKRFDAKRGGALAAWPEKEQTI
ncbi:hypothetical protein D1007_23851 [Hordeum vulgare]|nr:hypothetical protein D1007_23851 [Hordeum vulgare]